MRWRCGDVGLLAAPLSCVATTLTENALPRALHIFICSAELRDAEKRMPSDDIADALDTWTCPTLTWTTSITAWLDVCGLMFRLFGLFI